MIYRRGNCPQLMDARKMCARHVQAPVSAAGGEQQPLITDGVPDSNFT